MHIQTQTHVNASLPQLAIPNNGARGFPGIPRCRATWECARISRCGATWGNLALNLGRVNKAT